MCAFIFYTLFLTNMPPLLKIILVIMMFVTHIIIHLGLNYIDIEDLWYVINATMNGNIVEICHTQPVQDVT